MMISFSDEVSGLRMAGSAPPGRSAEGTVRGRMRALTAARILSAISSVYSRIPVWIEILGLVTKSTAPSSSARIVISEPRSVSDETMTTGIGRRRISFSRKSRPSIFGISTSRVSTSGLVCLISSRATSGSGATPTTSMSGWLPIISFMTLRISAESSTISTLIFIRAFSIRTGRSHHRPAGL